MRILLYQYIGEWERIEKGNFLTLLFTAEGKLKTPTDLLMPTLLLSVSSGTFELLIDEDDDEIDDVGIIRDSGNVLNFNYVFIEGFNRFYIVKGIQVASDSLMTVSLEIDPLYSFKDTILNTFAMVSRNEFESDAMLIDSLRPFKTIPTIEVNEIATEFDFSFNQDGKCVFLVTLQKPFATIPTNAGNCQFPPLMPADFVDWPSSMLNDIDSRAYSMGGKNAGHYAVDLPYMEAVSEYVLNNENYDSNIISCVAFPFELDATNGFDDTPTLLHWYDTYLTPFKDPGTDSEARQRENRDPRNHGFRYRYGGIMPYLILFDASPLIPAADDYIDLQPYSAYEVFIPFAGWITLDAAKLAGHRVICYYTLSTYDGTGVVCLYEPLTKTVIHRVSVSVGSRIDFTKSNITTLKEQQLQRGVSLAISAMSSLLSSSFMASSGNVAGAAASAGGMIGNAINAGLAYSRDHLAKSSGGTDANLASCEPRKPYLKRTSLDPLFIEGSQEFAEYAHIHGLPLMQVRRLGDMQGFTVIDSIHMDIPNALESETALVVAQLLKGVII